jgi:multiple sugar transport system ATP-binding protein
LDTNILQGEAEQVARVVLKNLIKRFGNVTAVNAMNLEVNDKEFLVLLGPSGCGKTTALRCIAGLETPEEGEIYIGDKMVNDLDPKQRNIAMVFQSYALYPHMTVFKNMAFPLENMKLPPEEIKDRVQKTAKLLKVETLLDRKPKQLSGGQRQRVALGRAIVRDPTVFLMDEPLSNLDAKLRVYMRAELKKLQKELGVTTVYVTHDQVEAMTMGDKVAIMNEGILQQVGTPDDIYTRPANMFVAGFIGSPPTNFFDCNLLGGEPCSLDSGEFTYPLPEDVAKAARKCTSETCVMGVRPQDILVYRSPKQKKNLIKAMLDVVEPRGDMAILDFKVGNYMVKAVVSPDFEANVGDELWLEIPTSKVHVFDKQTGKTLV